MKIFEMPANDKVQCVKGVFNENSCNLEDILAQGLFVLEFKI